MKFRVNDACISCGLCESTCPEVFTLHDGEQAKAVEGDVDISVLETAEMAKDGCPVDAIEEDD